MKRAEAGKNAYDPKKKIFIALGYSMDDAGLTRQEWMDGRLGLGVEVQFIGPIDKSLFGANYE